MHLCALFAERVRRAREQRLHTPCALVTPWRLMAHPQTDMHRHTHACVYFRICPCALHLPGSLTHAHTIIDWFVEKLFAFFIYWLEYCLVYIIAAGRMALRFEFLSFNCISTVTRKIARSLLISHKCECHSLCSRQSKRIVRIWIRSSALRCWYVVFKVFRFAAIAFIGAYSCSFCLFFSWFKHDNVMPVNNVWSLSRTFHRRPRFNGLSADATAEATSKKWITL